MQYQDRRLVKYDDLFYGKRKLVEKSQIVNFLISCFSRLAILCEVLGGPTLVPSWMTEDLLHLHDLPATVLHLIGIPNPDLIYRYKGRPETLTTNEGTGVHKNHIVLTFTACQALEPASPSPASGDLPV